MTMTAGQVRGDVGADRGNLLLGDPNARSQAFSGRREGEEHASSPSNMNVGSIERGVSMVAGGILLLQGLSRGTITGLVTAAVGGALVYRGATGQCQAYQALGIDTSDTDPSPQGRDNAARKAEQRLSKHGVEVGVSFLVGKSPGELYQVWRQFDRLPTFMSHLKSVRVTGEKTSKWTAQAPRIYGDVEWEAEITRDDKDQLIAWRSLPGGDLDTTGEVRFEPAMGDRGTYVHVLLRYVPPAGKVGHWFAVVTGNGPEHQIREDLRNFKRLMEVGELPTTRGQAVGSCGK